MTQPDIHYQHLAKVDWLTDREQWKCTVTCICGHKAISTGTDLDLACQTALNTHIDHVEWD